MKLAIENANLCGKICDIHTLLKYAAIAYSHKTDIQLSCKSHILELSDNNRFVNCCLYTGLLILRYHNNGTDFVQSDFSFGHTKSYRQLL